MMLIEQCPECERVFDLMDEADADEWYYGHDCEDGGTIIALSASSY